jgi:hypothetical protein
MKSGGEATASGSGLAEPLEAGPELLVVDRHLTVEHERARRQLQDRRRDVAEAARVVAPVTADQADALAVLVRQHPPAVDLFFVDPPGRWNAA